MFDPKRFRRPVIPEKFDGMVVNPEFKDFLIQIGFTDFERVFGFSGGHSFKKIRQRSVARIDFSCDGGRQTFYLKRHNAEKLRAGSERFSDFGAGSTSQGMLEFENIVAFRRHGLATVTPVAAGVKMVGESHAESFLLTEDFSPWVSLEWLLFNRPEYFTGPGASRRKKMLLEKIGRFARKMHDEGFNHKDFNATHILLGGDRGPARAARNRTVRPSKSGLRKALSLSMGHKESRRVKLYAFSTNFFPMKTGNSSFQPTKGLAIPGSTVVFNNSGFGARVPVSQDTPRN